MITPDLLFSYWIFGWFVIYYIIHRFSHIHWLQIINPFFVLLIDVIFYIAFMIILLYQGGFQSWFPLFLCMGILFKFIPLYLVYPDKRNMKYNMICMFILIVLYLFYLWLRNTNVISVYTDTMNSLVHGKNDTPFMYLVHKFVL
jgi:hypothetical protein